MAFTEAIYEYEVGMEIFWVFMKFWISNDTSVLISNF